MSDEKEVAVIDPTPMQLISQVVDNPDFDVEKLAKMMDLQERYEDRQAGKAYNQAVTKFQNSVQAIPKETKGAHDIRYAKLDKIMEVIQPALAAQDLSVRFSTSWSTEGYLTAVCTVSHVLGHSEASEITIPVDDKMAANSSQKMGSANSYAKRYALSNALNLAFCEHDSDATDLDSKISTDQAIEINDLLDELKLPKGRVVKFMKWAKAKTVEEIPASFYADAKRHLEGIRDGDS